MALLNEFRPLILSFNGNSISDDLRIRVQGSKNMTLLPDFFIVEIYNISDSDASLLKSETLKVVGVDGGVICSGEIDDVYTHSVGANIVTSVSVVDGKKFWNTSIAKSLGGGTTVSMTIRSIIQNASMGSYNANDTRIIRGQCYSGRLADCISTLAKSVHARAFITNGAVFVSAKGKAADVITIKDTDILDDTNAGKGMRIVKTVVKGYPVGALVNVGNQQYRLVSQKISADNFEGAWDSNLVLVDERELSDNGMEGG